VLELLRGQHPAVDLVLEHRELSKLKSTYVDALPAAADPEGRVHTSYSQAGAITGRLSSSNPNLQNIPTRTELGRRVRNGFIAAPGHVLLSVDYSQIELRIVAHMAKDEAMLGAFREGQDIHAATAAAIYNVPLEEVLKEQRRHAKAINFGLIYGMSAFGLTRSTDLTLAEAEAFVKAYFERFPGIKSYLDNMRKLATSQGYVETLLGRRRYFPALKTQTSQALRNREEREAINSPIQGTAADIEDRHAQDPARSRRGRAERADAAPGTRRDHARMPPARAREHRQRRPAHHGRGLPAQHPALHRGTLGLQLGRDAGDKLTTVPKVRSTSKIGLREPSGRSA
jgi:DNA polymerase-1